MKNVRKGSEDRRAVQSTKKGIKKKKDIIGNSLMKKLEPLLPMARKTTKFISPYKSPQITKKTSKENEKQEPATALLHQQSSTSDQNETCTQTGNKLGERRSEERARNANAIASNVLPNVAKVSPVKIQPIDPYKFCEPFVKDCAKSRVAPKDMLFKRSKEEQSRVNQEILILIKRTAEAINMIRTQHEEWKKRQQ